MRLVRQFAAVLGAGVMLCASGCGRGGEGEPESARPAPLASVNGVAITEDDFASEVQRRIDQGRPLGDAESVLNELIEREAMLQKARTSPVMDDPDVRRELENQTLVKWLDRTLQEQKDAVTVTEADLRAAYEAEIDRFSRPAMARLAILYREAHPNDPDDTVTELRTVLESARAAYLADPAAATRDGRIPGFGTVAAEQSEHTISRYRGGDLGWIQALAGQPERVPGPVLDAGFALPVGGVSGVIEAGDGLYVVMKQDERPAAVTPFEEAAVSLRRRALRDKQEAVERDFTRNLMAEADVEINPERAARLSLPAPAPVEPPTLRPVPEVTNR